MDLDNAEEFDQLATLVSGFANASRLALLLGFYHGYTAKEVTDFLGISRAGVQDNIERMVDADLVYRPTVDDGPTYALTPLGEFFAYFYDALGPALLDTVRLLDQADDEVRQELRESPVADSLSEAEREKLVHTRKWQQVDDEVRDKLTADDDATPAEADSTPRRAHPSKSGISPEEFEDFLEEMKEETEE